MKARSVHHVPFSSDKRIKKCILVVPSGMVSGNFWESMRKLTFPLIRFKITKKKSFIDYMNELRVNQAKKLLTDTDYNQYTITAIGLESGCNSKSTF